jgi:hypothetical protein
VSTRPDATALPGCRQGRTPLAERLAAKEADRVRLHREAAERLQRRHG